MQGLSQAGASIFINGFPSGPKPYEEVLTFLRKVRPWLRHYVVDIVLYKVQLTSITPKPSQADQLS